MKLPLKFNNFVGWVCVITIILIPIGLLLLLQGHLILALLEIEYNTRKTNILMKNVMKKYGVPEDEVPEDEVPEDEVPEDDGYEKKSLEEIKEICTYDLNSGFVCFNEKRIHKQ